MKKEALASLSLIDYGLTPCSSVVEARQLKNGFSVVLDADRELLPRPIRIGATKKDYSWRIFGEILCRIQEGFIVPEHYSSVEIYGESGIRAEILVLCWSYPEGDSSLIDWLLGQSEKSLDYIADNVGSILDKSAQEFLAELADVSSALYRETDLIDLLPLHYNLQAFYTSLLNLQERHSQRAKELRDKKLAPFREAIEVLMDAWAEQHPFRGGMNAQIGYSARRGSIRRYIENWAIKYSEIPKGVHELGNTDQWNIKVGELDFGSLHSKTKS